MIPTNIEIELEDAAEELFEILSLLKAKAPSSEDIIRYYKNEPLNIYKQTFNLQRKKWFEILIAPNSPMSFNGRLYVRNITPKILKRYLKRYNSSKLLKSN